MSKKNQFEEFRKAALSEKNPFLDNFSDIDAESDTRIPHRPSRVPNRTRDIKEKPSKNYDRELVSFHINKDLKRNLGFLKFETGLSYNDLYNEAIEDLLMKYGK